MRRTLPNIMSKLRRSPENRHAEDSSSDSVDSSDSDMSATTLPTGRTYYDKSRYKWKSYTRMTGTTAKTSTLGVTARSRTTMQRQGLSSTLKFPHNGGYRNRSDTNSTSVALTATLASLGCVVLILLILIAYFMYTRWVYPLDLVLN